MTGPALNTGEALAEYRRLLAAGVSEEAARVLAAEVTSRPGCRGDDVRAYWRHTRHASPLARQALAAYEYTRARRP